MNFKIVAISVIGFPLLFAVCQPRNAEKTTPGIQTISDSALLDIVEKQTFEFFWDGAEPHSGMGRERFHVDNDYPEHDKNVVATGGSGFGVMAILSAIHRGFITREQGLKRLETIVTFLGKADRFHGAWPHWIDGETGKVKPFGTKDDGGGPG